jgi:DUF4097 and DUF4098 domain-containing protein YvlB
MKVDQSSYVSREESFEIENPEVSVTTITSDVKIKESLDGKCEVVILAKSEKAKRLAELVEIVAIGRKISIRVDKKNRDFWGLSDGGLHGLSVILTLPKTSTLKVKTVSADVEVDQTLAGLELGSVSGDITVLQNPQGTCVVKTVSGDISTHTFSACHYVLKSVSGNIRVFVAPNLEVEVDGKTLSGDMESEIPLNQGDFSPSGGKEVVNISTSTLSGNFVLARN